MKGQGKVILVGMGKLETTLNVSSMITKQVTVVGSNGSNPQDIAEIYALFADGSVKPTVTEIGFDEIPEGFERLERHEIAVRLVVNME